jgi:hypothetical protein
MPDPDERRQCAPVFGMQFYGRAYNDAYDSGKLLNAWAISLMIRRYSRG